MYKRYEHRNAWLLTSKRWHVIRHMSLLNTEIRSTVGSSVLKNDVQLWSSSFSTLMKSSIGRQLFTKFLESEYSDENMLFWNAFEEYKREKMNTKRAMMAKEIFGMFLAPGTAPMEVNVDSKVRKELKNRVFVDTPSVDVFADSQSHIFHLMERDCFRRFTQSDIYANFLRQLETTAEINEATKACTNSRLM